MRLALHPKNPETRLVQRVLEVFEKGGVVVYPTDSGYSLGCDALNKSGVNRLYHLKRAMKKYFMALMVRDFSVVTDFAKVDNAAYRYMKKTRAGPLHLHPSRHGARPENTRRQARRGRCAHAG